ncbi:MAG: GIY-YIG nuclease family protein [Nitrospinae bacterium]|nr:GIY-YIG nuclease family protein [Nitrospinota bacterium]
MKKYFVYILECNDGSYYTGVTNNLEKRLYEHENGLIKGCYTHGRRPVHLVFCDSFIKILNAIEREKQIKGWSRKKKEAVINGKFEILPELSKNKTDKHNHPLTGSG